VSARSEYDAAYFTLLRALEERDELLRYRDWLAEERRHLDAFGAATRDRTDPLSRRVRKPIDLTTKPLLEAVGRRRAVVLDEQRRVDDRIAAAEAFVTECETEVDALRR
jgi:predicted GTPase